MTSVFVFVRLACVLCVVTLADDSFPSDSESSPEAASSDFPATDPTIMDQFRLVGCVKRTSHRAGVFHTPYVALEAASREFPVTDPTVLDPHWLADVKHPQTGLLSRTFGRRKRPDTSRF